MAEGNEGPFVVIWRDSGEQITRGEFDTIALAEQCIEEQVCDEANGLRIAKVVRRYERGWKHTETE